MPSCDPIRAHLDVGTSAERRSPGTQEYIEMVRSVTDRGDGEGAESKIISSIAKEVAITPAAPAEPKP